MKINYLTLTRLGLMIGAICSFTNAYGTFDTRTNNQKNRHRVKHLERQESKAIYQFKLKQNIKWDSPTAQIFALLLTSAMAVSAEPMTKTTTSSSLTPLPQPLDSNQLSLINHTVSSNVSDCAAAHFMTEALKTTAGSNSSTPLAHSLPETSDVGHTLHTSFSKIIKDLQACDYDKLTRKKQLALANKIPTLDAEIIDSLYTDIQEIARGMFHVIYKATLKHDRGPLKKGTKIAVRVGAALDSIIDNQIISYARLACLQDKHISSYIPPLYGAYYGQSNPDLMPLDKCEKVFYNEMYFVEGVSYDEYMISVEYIKLLIDDKVHEDNPDFFANAFYNLKSWAEKVQPRVIFEHYLGRWAIKNVAQQSIDDLNGDVLRHHMLEADDHYVVYHIDDKNYMFSPGDSPKQIDYDFSRHHTEKDKFDEYNNAYGMVDIYLNLRTPYDYRHFSDDMMLGVDLFQSIHANFQAFLVTEDNPIPDTHKIRHYYIDTERYSNRIKEN